MESVPPMNRILKWPLNMWWFFLEECFSAFITVHHFFYHVWITAMMPVIGFIEWKTLYLMVKTMVSCRFSLKPIQWSYGHLRPWWCRTVPPTRCDVKIARIFALYRGGSWGPLWSHGFKTTPQRYYSLGSQKFSGFLAFRFEIYTWWLIPRLVGGL